MDGFKCPFGRAIVADHGYDEMPQVTRSAQDVAVPLAPHNRQGCLDDGQRSQYVGFIKQSDFIGGRFLNGPDEGVTGIIDNYIEGPEMCMCSIYRCFCLRRLRYIQRQRQYPVTVFFPEVDETFHITGGGGHAVAALQGGFRPYP